MGNNYSGIYSVNEMFRLYPITFPLEASGGVISDFEQNGIIYRMHKFIDVGEHTFEVGFIPRAGASIDFLVVAGGGSGGQGNTTNANGGGGAGGLLHAQAIPLTSGIYAVKVGAGGAALADNVISAGNNGENSFFANFIAVGGGGGGGRGSVLVGKDGGSGGGAALYNSVAPYYGSALQTDVGGATGYGNAGGQIVVNYTGAGGGGAGSAGENGATTAPGGNGGQGLLLDITGENVGYAGGGGGGDNSSERAGDGFHGGGRGAGTTTYYSNTIYKDEINPITLGSGTPNAIPNTGGGGGAGTYWSAAWPTSGKGGSGIVIIRYPIGMA